MSLMFISTENPVEIKTCGADKWQGGSFSKAIRIVSLIELEI